MGWGFTDRKRNRISKEEHDKRDRKRNIKKNKVKTSNSRLQNPFEEMDWNEKKKFALFLYNEKALVSNLSFIFRCLKMTDKHT